MAAETFAYLCAVTLIGLFVWACLVTVSYAWQHRHGFVFNTDTEVE